MKIEPSRPMKIAVGAVGVLMLLAIANYLAGVMLFLSYRQPPGNADLFTVQRAYLSYEDPAARRRVRNVFGLSLLLCAGGAFAAWMSTRSRDSTKTLFGKARFANAADIRKEKLDGDKGIVLGRFKKELLRLGGYEFVLLAAPTRTGKGVGFCVPNLLQFTGSAVVLDIKGENYNLTSEFRRRYLGNEIVYFNPFSARTHRWNPLSYVSQDTNFRANDLMALATIIYPVNEKDPFWSDAAKNLFIGLALLVLETPELPPTIGEILRQGSGKGMAIEDYLRKVMDLRAAGERPFSNACRDALNRFLNSGEQALKGVHATFTASLTPWANAVIDKATSGDDFDLRDVRRKKVTIYLNIPAGEILQAAPIIKLFFSQLINENVKELPEHNPELKHQCLLLLDEFTAMGKVEIIAKGVGYMAGYNMRLALVIQDKNQLEAVYGKEDAHNIVSNMGAVIYFTPSQISEAEEYAKMIGNDTVATTSRQTPKGQLFGIKGEGGSSSTTEQYQSRAIMLPQELLQMSKDLQLVVRSGIPVIQADKVRYFTDPYFKERFTAVPMQEVTVGGERRQVPIPAALPSGDWAPYHQAVGASDFYADALKGNTAPASPGEVGGHAPAGAGTPPAAPAAKGAPPDLAPPPAPVVSIHAALRDLPVEPLPYDTLHAVLRRGEPAAHAVPPVAVANAYVDAMAAYWRLFAERGALTEDEPLVIIDLQPAHGEFVWKLLVALQERLASMGPDFPSLRYVACVDDADQGHALETHPYLADLIACGMFSTIPRDELLARDEALLTVNPVVVVAEALLSALPHALVALEGGVPVVGEVTAAPSADGEPRVSLAARWSVLDLAGTTPVQRSWLQACASDAAAPVRLPLAGAAILEAVDRLSSRRFLLLAADPAVSREQAVRGGAMGLPEALSVAPPPLPANYHALVALARAVGWEVSVDAGSGGAPDLLLLMGRAGDDVAGIRRLAGDLAGIRQNGADLLHRPAPSGRSAAQCLAELRRSEHDPHVLLAMYDALVGLDWSDAEAPHGAWQRALEQVWRLCLPIATGHSVHGALAYLAVQVGHFGLAREAVAAGRAVAGDRIQDLHIEALCGLHVGDHDAARQGLARAEALAGGDTDATHRQIAVELYRRAQSLSSAGWYDATAAASGPLRLQPLAAHHAAPLWMQSQGTDLSLALRRPAWTSLDDTAAWIAAVACDPGAVVGVVLHEAWGEIGMVGVDLDGDAGLLYFWVAAEHQAQGHGPSAARLMLAMLKSAGLRHVFAAVQPGNRRSLGALARLGFHPVTRASAPGAEGALVLHQGRTPDLSPEAKEALDRLRLEHASEGLA